MLLYCLLYHLEQTSTTSSFKRGVPDTDTEPPPPKRTMVSLARLEELQLENNRLKKQNDKYREEWMRTFLLL